MGVSARLAYGIKLTDSFGGQLKHVPDELFEFARGPEVEEDSDYYEAPEEFVVDQVTCESPALVLGVLVPTGKTGWTWIQGEDPFAAVHQQYLEVLSKCPERVRSLVDALAEPPRLHVLAGEN